MKNKRRRKSHDSLPKVAISCVLRADVLKSEEMPRKYCLALISTVFLYSSTLVCLMMHNWREDLVQTMAKATKKKKMMIEIDKY